MAFALVGCDSKQKQQRLAEAERQFDVVVKAQEDGLQWRLDDSTAYGLELRNAFTKSQYLMFRDCHDDPPHQAKNQTKCKKLMDRVRSEEAKQKASSHW